MTATTDSFHFVRDSLVVTSIPTRRRRHTRKPESLPCGPVRPGRFFRPRRDLVWLRLDMRPAHLGDADWLLYRRRFNPYHKSSFKHAAYERGFVASKILSPCPNWPPL